MLREFLGKSYWERSVWVGVFGKGFFRKGFFGKLYRIRYYCGDRNQAVYMAMVVPRHQSFFSYTCFTAMVSTTIIGTMAKETE